MSFFDDDEPPTRAARPRRPAGARPAPATTGTRARATSGGSGGPGSDPQQLMVRRAVALGVGALILILLVVGVKGCLSSRTENSLKDYNRNVSAVISDSNDQVSRRLFELLAGGTAGNTIDLQQNVNQVRVTADEDVRRARAFDVPGDMKDAQYSLLEVLTFRAEGVQKIADDLPNLDGNQSEDAASRIGGQMAKFLASDIVYSQRTVPYIQQVLDDHEIENQEITPSVFLPDTQWMDAAFVRKKLTGKGSGRTSGTPAPGTHGHGLLDVSVSNVALAPAPAVTRVPAGSNPVFSVHFANQGENDEFDVNVKVGITGSGDPINVQKRVDQTTKGVADGVVVQVPLGTAPPIGTPVRVTVQIVPVPGEVNTDNNSQTYTVIFSR